MKLVNITTTLCITKSLLLFAVLLLHITLLDLLVLNSSGLRVLWQESIKVTTIMTHISVVTTALIIFLVVNQYVQRKVNNS